MNENKARLALLDLVEKYVRDSSERIRLNALISDAGSRQLPVRGLLHEIRKGGAQIDLADEAAVAELVFRFG